MQWGGKVGPTTLESRVLTLQLRARNQIFNQKLSSSRPRMGALYSQELANGTASHRLLHGQAAHSTGTFLQFLSLTLKELLMGRGWFILVCQVTAWCQVSLCQASGVRDERLSRSAGKHVCHGPGLSGQKKVDVPNGSEIYRFCFVSLLLFWFFFV